MHLYKMWKIFKIPVITATTTIVLMYLVRWIENFARNRKPLKITVLSDDISLIDLSNPPSYPKFFLPINFTRRTNFDYEISLSNFNIKSEKISDVVFSIDNSIYEEQRRSSTRKFAMDRNSKSGYLLINIKPPKDCTWNKLFDILKSNKKTFFEVSFDYRLSTETKKRPFNQKLKKTMNSLVEKLSPYVSSLKNPNLKIN